MSTAMRKGIHVASMDAVFKISQTTYRDRKIRLKNFLPLFRLAAYNSKGYIVVGNFIPHLML